MMDQQAFIQYIAAIKDLLYRLALRLLVSKEAAEDAVQEVIAKLWKIKERIPDYQHPEAYAVSMLKNYCYDQLKLKQHNNLRIVHSNYQDTSSRLQHQLEIKDELDKVQKLIGQLNEQEQTLIQLRDIEQLSYTEIAAITEMKETAIRVALSRARKKIRQRMLALHRYGTQGNTTINR